MEARVIDLTDKSRADWLGLRGLGSSDAAAVCGLHPWKSPYEVWAEKVGIAPPVEETEAMEIGTALEPVIAALFAKRTGLAIEKCNKLFIDPEREFRTATPDFDVWEDGELGIVETKNTNVFASKEWDGGLPDAAHVQLMHQLDLTGRRFGYACALIGGNRLKWHRVERDEGVITRVREIECDFWTLVESRTPPPLRADDGETLGRIYSADCGAEVVLPDAALDWVRRYEEAKDEAKRWEKEKDYASAQLKLLLGDAAVGTVGEHRVLWRTQHRKGYTVQPTSYRKFEVRGFKGKE